MKNLVIAVTALSLLAPSAAFAQYRQPGYGHPPRVEKSWNKRHDDRRDWRRHDDRRERWTRGKQLPRSYRSHVVRDYGRYRLSKPPRGHEWVRVNNDYLLISIASGVIASIVAGR
ncbi:RcnB family protein [Brucella sp. IR073]|uniref:RcnB family protein n=1 Tax=unclassified Brucella TaxID=2632610 RepID=UPI003B985334